MRKLLAVLGLLILPVFAGRAQAVIPALVVTSTADNGTGGCTLEGDGDGCTLREALEAANIAVAARTINFKTGLTGTVTLTSNLPTSLYSLDIQGPGADKITVSGDSLYSGLSLAANATSFSLSGLTLKNFSGGSHGALSVVPPVAGSTVTNCIFIDNKITSGSGAAISNAGGQMEITNCQFSGNSAPNGGALSQVPGGMTLTNCTFTGNKTTDTSNGSGGAMWASTGDTFITNCTFTDNTAVQGGAIFKASGKWQLENCSFTNNATKSETTGIEAVGGALSIVTGSGRDIVNCSFSGNTASSNSPRGGAVYYGGGTDGAVRGCQFANNKATGHEEFEGGTASGGAVHIDQANITLEDSSFIRNQATGYTGNGGAVHFGGGVTTTVHGCRFTDNKATGKKEAEGGIATGGAVYISNATITVEESTFARNEVSGYTGTGGGILFGGGSPATILNNKFIGNTVTGVDDSADSVSSGGAFHFFGGNNNSSVEGCEFTDNSVTGDVVYGGAFNVPGGSAIGISDNQFTNNSAKGATNGSGGGVYVDSAPVDFTRCNFTSNKAEGGSYGSGGGIITTGGGYTVNVKSCVFDSNSAKATAPGSTAGGGGFSNSLPNLSSNGVTVKVSNTTLMGNTVIAPKAYGGGFINASNYTSVFTNCTVYGNSVNGSSEGFGGGIALIHPGNASIIYSTIAGNSANQSGGGVYIAHDTSFTTSFNSSIVSGNTATNGADIFRLTTPNPSPVSSSGYNVIQTDSNVPITAGTNDKIGVDPLLVAGGPKYNGGPVPTIALQASSPALENGNTTGTPPTDERGVNRPQGTLPDSGAFESLGADDQPGRLVVTVTENDDDGNYAPDDISLREAIEFALTIPGSTITFDIPGAGPHIIDLTAALPLLTEDMTIQGPTDEEVTVRRSLALGNVFGELFNIFTIYNGSTVSISHLTISNGNNKTKLEGTGGGIYVGNATLQLDSCTVSGNTSFYGGGLGVQGGDATVTNCTFTGNSSQQLGSAIYNEYTSTITIRNTTVSGNTADGGSAAVATEGFQPDDVAVLNMDSCTVANNSGVGVGVYQRSDSQANAYVSNSILGINSLSSIELTGDAVFHSLGHNLCNDAANGDGTTAPGGYLNAAGDIRNTDPQIEVLGDNGGPTQTHALKGTSPALNKGFTTLTTDQRGVARPYGNADDIGAFELNIINHDPVLDSIPRGFVNAGEKFVYNASSSDPDDGDIRTYSLGDGAPVGVTIDPSSGLIQWQTSYGTSTGTYTFTVIVSDNHGGSDSQVVTVIVSPRRYAPVLAPIGAKTVNEETKLTIVLSATDQDTAQNKLTFYATNLPAGATFTTATKTFTWTPTEAQGPGTYDVTFRVNDGGLDGVEKVRITVNEVNKAPALNVGAAKTFVGDKWNYFSVSATDPDLPANSLTYSVTPPAAIAGVGTPQVNVNSSTGAISVYGPPSTANYTIPLSIKVTDSGTPALSDTKTLNVTITPPLVVWMVVPTFTSTDVTLAYKLKNNSTKPLTGIWIQGTASAVVNSVTKSVGTTTQQVQSGGQTGIVWNGFSLNAGAEATLTIKLKRPTGSGKPVIGVLYPAFATAGNGTVPSATPVVNTP